MSSKGSGQQLVLAIHSHTLVDRAIYSCIITVGKGDTSVLSLTQTERLPPSTPLYEDTIWNSPKQVLNEMFGLYGSAALV